jgi:hypothetical protein
LLAGIKRLDRHAAVAGWTKTWATFLTQQPHLFASEKVFTFGDLETFEVDRGIEDRLWGPAPAQSPDEDEANDGAAVEAALAAAGIETADLFGRAATAPCRRQRATVDRLPGCTGPPGSLQADSDARRSQDHRSWIRRAARCHHSTGDGTRPGRLAGQRVSARYA